MVSAPTLFRLPGIRTEVPRLNRRVEGARIDRAIRLLERDKAIEQRQAALSGRVLLPLGRSFQEGGDVYVYSAMDATTPEEAAYYNSLAQQSAYVAPEPDYVPVGPSYVIDPVTNAPATDEYAPALEVAGPPAPETDAWGNTWVGGYGYDPKTGNTFNPQIGQWQNPQGEIWTGQGDVFVPLEVALGASFGEAGYNAPVERNADLEAQTFATDEAGNYVNPEAVAQYMEQYGEQKAAEESFTYPFQSKVAALEQQIAEDPGLRGFQVGLDEYGQPAIMPMGLGESAFMGLGQLAGSAGQALGQIPYFNRAMNALGDVRRYINQGGLLGDVTGFNLSKELQDVAGDVGQALGDLSYHNYGLGLGNVGRKIGEAIVPTTVEEAAFELLPGVGFAPGAASFLRQAGKEGLGAAARGVFRGAADEALGELPLGRKLLTETPAFSPEGAALRAGETPGFGLKAAAPIGGGAPFNAGDFAKTPDGRVFRVADSFTTNTSEGTLMDVVRLEGGGDFAPSQLIPATAEEYRVSALARAKAAAGKAEPGQAPALGGGAAPAPPNPAISKLVDALRSVQRVAGDTEDLRHVERQRRVARSAGALNNPNLPIEQRFASARGALAGAMPTAQFEPLGLKLEPDEVRSMVQQITDAPVLHFDKIRADAALSKIMFGDLGAVQPSELEVLGRIFGPDLPQAVLGATRGKAGTAFDVSLNILGTPRRLITTADMSAPLRQGILLAPGHQKEFRDALAPMMRAYFSENVAREIDAAIRTSPFAEAMDKAGLFLASLDGYTLSTREEQFISKLFDNVPLVRNAERAYVTFLNKLRADVFSTYAQKWTDQGITGAKLDKRLKSLATYLNAATGRGELGLLTGQGAQLAGALFFAPRFLVSRFQAPAQLLAPGTDMAVRMLITRDLASFFGTGMTLLALAYYAGADVELDPRSSDFGKIQIGSQRIDVWGGYQQMARYTAQLITGEGKSEAGDIRDIKRHEVLWRYVRSKASPAASVAINTAVGKNLIGQEYRADMETLKRESWQMLLPLFIQDIIDGVRQEGLRGGILALPSFFGMGSLTYPPGVGKQLGEQVKGMGFKDPTTGESLERWSQLSSAQQNQARKLNSEIDRLLAASEEANNGSISTQRITEMGSAWDAFKQSGDIDSYFGQMNNISDKYRAEYAKESWAEVKNTSEWNKKLADHFDGLNALTNPKEREKYIQEFESNLNPEEKEAYQATLLSSDDPNYAMVKLQRDTVFSNYFEAKDTKYASIVAQAPIGSPVKNFATYDQLREAADSGNAQAQAIKRDIDGDLSDYGISLRVKDPKLDAMVFILGYSETVRTLKARDYVIAWAKQNGVNLKTPPIR